MKYTHMELCVKKNNPKLLIFTTLFAKMLGRCVKCKKNNRMWWLCKSCKPILNRKKKKKHVKCWSWEIVLLNEKYRLILNLMPATCLKEAGQGHIYHCVISPLLLTTICTPSHCIDFCHIDLFFTLGSMEHRGG